MVWAYDFVFDTTASGQQIKCLTVVDEYTRECLAIDVAGAGGTSWSQVEMYRAPDEFTRKLAASYSGWGIPTAESIQTVKKAAPRMTVFASGGLKDGLDIAKCIALGASLGGIASQFLKAAAVSTEKVAEMMKLVQLQIQVTMFAAGVSDVPSLQRAMLVEG